jgi:hypothetical protein
MITWTIQYIKPKESDKTLVSVCSFLNGHGHVAVYQGCWALVLKNEIKNNLCKEFIELIKKLPSSPEEYEPYTSFKSNRLLKISK